MQMSGLLKDLPHDKPIFVHGKVYNSTANDVLAKHCRNVDVPVISVHGLRHTHASLLLFAGVSIASVSRRLGHASMTTTQETYLHVIRELENKDVDIVMRHYRHLSNGGFLLFSDIRNNRATRSGIYRFSPSSVKAPNTVARLRNTRLGTNPPQVTRPRRISAHEEPEIVVPERSRTVTRHTPEPKAFRNRCYSQA